MKRIEEMYTELCNRPSDINEHLPTLFRYAEGCKHITEMGTRGVISTWAFLLAKPKKLVCVDIQDCPLEPALWEAMKNNIELKFIKGDSGSPKLQLEETDLLFIDTWHCYDHMKKELALHPSKVKKYIIFHDTTLYADKPETVDYESLIGPNFSQKGIWPAIEEFLNEYPEWVIAERFHNNNGLTILKRS
jgi:hypothetical protein